MVQTGWLFHVDHFRDSHGDATSREVGEVLRDLDVLEKLSLSRVAKAYTGCTQMRPFLTILTSADGGASWTSQVAAGGSYTVALDGVSCTGARSCVAVGDQGEILRMG